MRLRDMRPGFMLDHRFTRRHISEYLDGELDARGRERVERHSHLCPVCHRMVATLRQMLDGLRAMGQDPSDTGSPIADGVIARLRARQDP
jgi:anti-sigma factor RsiW